MTPPQAPGSGTAFIKSSPSAVHRKGITAPVSSIAHKTTWSVHGGKGGMKLPLFPENVDAYLFPEPLLSLTESHSPARFC
jgi:hypothetical protein